MPLFEEFGQTSQETFGLESESIDSWDVCQNSSRSGIKQNMQLFKEFGQTSQETFGLESESNVSWDV